MNTSKSKERKVKRHVEDAWFSEYDNYLLTLHFSNSWFYVIGVDLILTYYVL